MLPADFPYRNMVFKKPENMTDEQCMDLPVFKGEVVIDEANTKIPAIISYWKFSKEDLETIKETGCIWLSITGYSMPPVSLFTEDPFTNMQPEYKDIV